jgi:hypothetical protein
MWKPFQNDYRPSSFASNIMDLYSLQILGGAVILCSVCLANYGSTAKTLAKPKLYSN